MASARLGAVASLRDPLPEGVMRGERLLEVAGGLAIEELIVAVGVLAAHEHHRCGRSWLTDGLT